MSDLKKQFFRPRQRSPREKVEEFDEVMVMGPVIQRGSWRLWLLVGIFLLILGGSVYILFFSDYFKVKQVIVTGGPEEMQQEVKNMLGWETDYMVIFNEKSFAGLVAEKYNDLAGVEVVKTWPDRLDINLIPEIPKVVWKSENRLFLVNASGIVLGQLEEPERLAKYNDLPVVTDVSNLPVEDGKKIVSRDFVSFVDVVRDTVDMSIKKRIESYEVGETTFNLKVKFQDGFWVYFDTLRNAELQVEKLAVFLNHGELVDQYVDLRVPGKVYFK